LNTAIADVNGWNHHRMQRVAQAAALQVRLERVAQCVAAVFGSGDRARQVDEPTQRAGRQGAVGEHGRPVLGEQLHQPRHRNLEGERKGQDAADRRAGDQIEASSERFSGPGFQASQHGGGVQAEEAAAGEGKHTKAVDRLAVLAGVHGGRAVPAAGVASGLIALPSTAGFDKSRSSTQPCTAPTAGTWEAPGGASGKDQRFRPAQASRRGCAGTVRPFSLARSAICRWCWSMYALQSSWFVMDLIFA
jgi:hypothetical protein